MSDRYQALTIVLDDDYRSEDLEALEAAIKQLRGVADVTRHVTDMSDYLARGRVRYDLAQTQWEVFRAQMDGRKITVEPRESK